MKVLFLLLTFCISQPQWDYSQYIKPPIVEMCKKPKPDVPEPATIALLGLGSLVFLRKRK